MKKTALITGITGQDGSYLAELLVGKGYQVVGITSGSGMGNANNLDSVRDQIELVNGDITDYTFLEKAVREHKPEEIYNLASVSSVGKPWDDIPDLVALTALVPLYFLEIIRHHVPDTRFFQASSAEMYGEVTESPQSEDTPFRPRNPYGVAKLFAHNMVSLYRNDHDVFAASGILFNHESPRRRAEFVTSKITRTLSDIKNGRATELVLGNLDAKRDWSSAEDFVEAMWMSLQHKEADSYVFASGKVHTVREFVETAASTVGIAILWEGKGEKEVGKNGDGSVIVRVNPVFYRPIESHIRQGDITKIQKELGWQPKTSFEELVRMMVTA